MRESVLGCFEMSSVNGIMESIQDSSLYTLADSGNLHQNNTKLISRQHAKIFSSETSLSLYLSISRFSRQVFSVALEPVVELALVDQTGLKLTTIKDLPASTSQVLGLKGCATTAWL